MPERTTKIHKSRYTERLPLVVGNRNDASAVLMETLATYRGLPAHTEVWVSGDDIESVLGTFLTYIGEDEILDEEAPDEDEVPNGEPAEGGEEPEPEPEPGEPQPGEGDGGTTQSYDVPSGTVDDVLAWVDTDPGRASAALEVEITGQARVTLVTALEAILDADQEG